MKEEDAQAATDQASEDGDEETVTAEGAPETEASPADGDGGDGGDGGDDDASEEGLTTSDEALLESEETIEDSEDSLLSDTETDQSLLETTDELVDEAEEADEGEIVDDFRSDDTLRMLEPFLSQLREVDPQLEGLEVPAIETDLAACEESLGVKLPPGYRRFLLQFNGGSAYDTTLFSVGADDDFDLARVNLSDREKGLPEHLLAFAVTVSGDVYCFNTQQADDIGEAPVVLLDPEDGTLLPVAASFVSFLERLPRLEAELAEARGPQPMTIVEWEEFLERERAKLRRLSKTPARELSMPDPEQIRADLGGKIPVDPRHLKPKE